MKRIVRTVLMLIFIGATSMAGSALIALSRDAIASRDASGNYTLPAGNPIPFGSKSSSTLYNSNNSDIATELQDSLSRSAKGAMLAQLKLFDGTVGTPGLGWGSETGTGWRRAGAGDVRFGVGGVDKLFFSATGLGIGVAPTQTLHVLKTGSSGATAAADTLGEFESSASFTLALLGANANYEGLRFGDVAAAGRGGIFYFNSTNGNADQMQFNTGSALRGMWSNLGLTVGASGTAISASIRNTASHTGAIIVAPTSPCDNFSITVTGAGVGDECAWGPPSALPNAANGGCTVPSANVCTISMCTASTTNQTMPTGTYSCRVFKP